MRKHKICMLGAFAVGKTSLVNRSVHSVFSERYLTTVGVRVERKTVALSPQDVHELLIWDIQGNDDQPGALRPAYLRGGAAYLIVVDGTRRETLADAAALKETADAIMGQVPFAILLNKSDRTGDWAVSREDAAALGRQGWATFETSAKTGHGVEEAFRFLSGAVAALQPD